VTLRDELARRVLSHEARLPTSRLGRLARTARAAVGTAWSARSAGGAGHEVDPEALAKLVASIGTLKGIPMKVGQIMSYIDVALPDELREALSVLQTHAPAMPASKVREILETELGDRARELTRTLDDEPLAAASIGQVHRAELADGVRVAVKVQYPDVDRAIAADFGPAAIGSTLASLMYPGARIDDFIREGRERFLEECDYHHEARAQSRFAELYAGHPVLTVPRVFTELSTRRVLTSELVDGASLDDFLASGPDQDTRDRIGVALFEFYVASLFRHRLYNCDPHPGNYLFLRDGRVAVLDYGCTRAFEADFVAKVARLTLAVHADDASALHASFVELGMVHPDAPAPPSAHTARPPRAATRGRAQSKRHAYDFATARDLVRSFHGPMLRDAARAGRPYSVDAGEAMSMRQILDRKKELMKLALPGEFLFLFRIRFGLWAVLARLGARADWHRLELETGRNVAG
jgi:predicted unusual protein kinase regulating ubiquinone biosynthesis (AarF/ABC1/UbiB family)